MVSKADVVTTVNKNAVIRKIKDLGPSPELLAGIAKHLEAKWERFKGLSDLQRANLFWEKELRDGNRITVPQDPSCEFSIVIPVYNEKKERIIRQIDSLRRQRGCDPKKFEVIYVVNNGPTDHSKRWSDVVSVNKSVIDEMRSISDLNVFVIDKSSRGNEIEGCNVGKARSRATAEASARYFENGKNGFLIHTDADSYFEDIFYFEKLTGILKENEDVIGLAGGLTWEFNPDGNDLYTENELYCKTKQLVLTKRWEALYGFLTGDERFTSKSYKTAFWGGHMISRSFESAVIGGFIDGNALEDEVLGIELAHYAAEREFRSIGVKDKLFLVTALRESTRTQGSIGRKYDKIDAEKPLLVPDALAPETFIQFKEKIRRLFSSGQLDVKSLKPLLTDSKGHLIIREDMFSDLIELLKPGMKHNPGTIQDIESVTSILYNSLYPKVSLTEEYYARLVEKVSQTPDGIELLQHIRLMSKNI